MLKNVQRHSTTPQRHRTNPALGHTTPQHTTTSLNAWADDAVIRITAPVGFFEPLGFSKGKSDKVMNLYHEAELKHGLVAMAACLGWYVTAAGVHPAFNSKLSSDPLEAA